MERFDHQKHVLTFSILCDMTMNLFCFLCIGKKTFIIKGENFLQRTASYVLTNE